MLQFICLLFPSFISVFLHRIINKKKELTDALLLYGIYVVFNNIFMLTFAVLSHLDLSSVSKMTTNEYYLIYLTISTIIASINPYSFKFIRKTGYKMINSIKKLFGNIKVSYEKSETPKKSTLKMIGIVLLFLIFIFNIVLRILYSFIIKNVGVVSFDEVIYHLKMPLKGVSKSMTSLFVKDLLIYGVIFIIPVFAIYFLIKKSKTIVNINARKNKISINLMSLFLMLLLGFNIVFFAIQFNLYEKKFNIIKTISSYFLESSFIEENYVDPKTINVTFKEKKNLIYIYIESMETTFMDEKNGGFQKKNIIPELTNIANNNISFSSNDNYSGMYQASYATWTVASMVSQTAGVPLKLPIDSNTVRDYDFLPGAYSLGQILEQNGYNNYLLIGSDKEFAGKKEYFENHGNYTIKDYNSAIEENIIPKDHYATWGMEDVYLFEYAKKTLNDISKEETPFNLTLLTVDTHFPIGYMDDQCKIEYKSENEYENAISCSSKNINDFIEWVKKQSFYKNTTIVLVGDHLSMADGNELLDENYYDRRIYNAIINSSVETGNFKNRMFIAFDMYPTTLASIGAEIPGERLGLGTNLFSEVPTIMEEYRYDIEKYNSEILKHSSYYDKKLIYNK